MGCYDCEMCSKYNLNLFQYNKVSVIESVPLNWDEMWLLSEMEIRRMFCSEGQTWKDYYWKDY